MLVSLVQRVIRSLDEELAPFKEASREESCDQAENDLLRERPVHAQTFRARAMPVRRPLPESPLACFHDPQAEQKISEGMGQNTGK